MALISRAVRQALTSAPYQMVITRGMAGEGLRGFSEHEKTIEDMYFTSECITGRVGPPKHGLFNKQQRSSQREGHGVL